MSGLLEQRASVRRQVVMITACGAIAVAGATALWWQADTKVAAPVAPLAGQATCTALVIDRDTGLATQAPCAESRVLVAAQGDPR